jgi:hypothetical protein
MIGLEAREGAHHEGDEQVDGATEEQREDERDGVAELSQREQAPETGERDAGGDRANAPEVERREGRGWPAVRLVVKERGVVSVRRVATAHAEQGRQALQQHDGASDNGEEEKDRVQRDHA